MFEDVDLAGARPRQVLLGTIAAVVVGAGLVTGIGTVAGFARLTRTIRDADFQWVLVCAAGEATVFAAYAGALREASAWDAGPRLRTAASLGVVLASFAATQLIAFAGVAGLAIVYWTLRRAGHDRHVATVRVIGLSTAVYLVFGVLGTAAALWALLARTVPLAITVPWLAAFPLVIVAARWFTQPSRLARLGATEEAGPVRHAFGIGIEATAWVRETAGSPAGHRLYGWATLYWLGDIASLWAALHAFGAHPALSALGVAYATGYLVQSLPIPFIATGGVDAATTFLLRSFGVPLDIGLAAVVTHRVFAFWLPVVPGTLFATALSRLGRHLRVETQEAPHPEG
jgi:uncharacterized membrane protein YbhN (UPF0104 family)